LAFAPIALTIPQYENFPNQWLKAFEQGTTTPLVMATDATGGTTVAKFQLDSTGFPVTAGNARLIPFINGDYDLWLFPTAAEADANDTSNAIQFADNLNADPLQSNFTSIDKRYGPVFATVAAMTAADPVSIDGIVVNIVQGSRYYTLGRLVAGDIGAGEYFGSAPQATDGFGDHDAANGVALLLKKDPIISTAQYGSDGSGDETTIIEAACLANSGSTILIPHSTFTVTAGAVAGADCNGCSIVGSGTVVTGNLQNTRSTFGLVLGGVNIDRRAVHPMIPVDSDQKLLYRDDTNNYSLYVPKQSSGYNILQLNNNVTTPGADSLATTSSDATGWRVNGVLDAVEVVVVHQVATSSNGVWGGIDLGTGIPTHTSGRDLQYQRSVTTGAWWEMTLVVPADGTLDIAFLRSSTVTTDATITVDSVAIDSNFDINSTTAVVEVRRYQVLPGSRVVRITNNDAGSASLQIIGCNYSTLKDSRSDMSYDTSGHYRNSAIIDPIVNNSANDYAIWDADATDVGADDGMWGGSFHGGETSITSNFYVEGVDTTLAATENAVGCDIRVVQDWTLSWAAKGGGSLSVESTLTALLSGYAIQMSQTGDMNTNRAYYTTLIGVNELFTELVMPEIITDITALPTGVLHPVGKTSRVEYKQGLQRISIEHTIYEQEEHTLGGSTVWPVIGSYHKYYYAPVFTGQRNITRSAAINIFRAI